MEKWFSDENAVNKPNATQSSEKNADVNRNFLFCKAKLSKIKSTN